MKGGPRKKYPVITVCALMAFFAVQFAAFIRAQSPELPPADLLKPPAPAVTPASQPALPAAPSGPLFDKATGWTKVRKIAVHEEISLSTAAYVRRALDLAEREKADLFVIDLETFGGRVDAAIQIRDALARSKIPTAVFINPRAISAGALISLATDRIVMAPGGTIGAATPIQVAPGSGEASAVDEKYVSYFRQEMRATAELKGRSGDIAEAMVDREKHVPGLNEKGKLVTLTTDQALQWKIAEGIAATEADFFRLLGLPETVKPALVEATWSEALAGFLTSQAVSSLLFIIMLVCAYMEYQTPGFGAFGFIALACFAVLFFAHYITGLASYTELVLFVAGVTLLMLEIFLIPGFGIVGLAGIAAILAAMVLMLVGSDFAVPDFTGAAERLIWSAGIAVAVMVAISRFLPKRPVREGGVFLGTEMAANAGYTTLNAKETALLGQSGVAITTLRPSGRVKIGGEEYQAQTEGDFVEKGTSVTVIRVDGTSVFVKAAPGASA